VARCSGPQVLADLAEPLAARRRLGAMNPAVVGVALALSVLIGRMLVMRRWSRGTIGTDRAAMLWSAWLPVAIVVYSGARQQLSVLTLVIAVLVGVVQFLTMRYLIRWFDGVSPRSS
jgi:hypothetical protein